MSLTVEKCIQAWTNSLRQMNAKADIVFFGDSLTFYGDFSPVFPDKVVCNLGLRGDTLQGLIERIEQIKLFEPTKVYLMAGINDIASLSNDSFKNKYELLITQIQNELPNVTIYTQSILPVNNRDFSISCNNHQIKTCNLYIEEIATKYNIRFIDLFPLFEQDGVLLKDYTIDGIHLNEEAYNCWYRFLKAIND